MKIAIVGGVAGGASAAARARRLDEAAEIIVFERGPDPSFANCGLPYYIGGEIVERSKLLVAPKQMLVDRHRLDVRTRQSVEAIDRGRKRLTVKNLVDGTTYEESYDKLILSPGASPLRPPIPGIDLPGIYTLRDLRDADRLREVTLGAKRAVVVGGGFIGLEMAENLVRRGIHTTIVELADQVLPPWDREMTTPIADQLRAHGVELILGDSAAEFAAGDCPHFAESSSSSLSSLGQRGRTAGEMGTVPLACELVVKLKSGRELAADFVVLSVGVRPENALATAAGLEVGPRGGIRVNEHMQTSDPDVYAVGDAVEVREFITGDPIQIPLAGPANRQGRIAADHIFAGDCPHFASTTEDIANSPNQVPAQRREMGTVPLAPGFARPTTYRGTQGTAVVGVFGMTAAMTGLSEKVLHRVGRAYEKIYLHPTDHASYYPGAERMSLKLLFDPADGKSSAPRRSALPASTSGSTCWRSPFRPG